MKYENEISLINKLIDASEIGIGNIADKSGHVSFGLPNEMVFFSGSGAIETYDTAIQEFYTLNKDVFNTWTFRTVEDEVFDLVKTLKLNNQRCSLNDIDILYQKLLSVEIQESEILFEFYSVLMNQDFMKFGDFTVYNYQSKIEDLSKEYPIFEKGGIYYANGTSKHLIGIKVKARENDKAVEIASNLCKCFENVFSYMLGDLNHKHVVKVFNLGNQRSTAAIVLKKHSMATKWKNDIRLPVEIENAFFKDPTQGNDKIWGLITKKGRTEIEERLLNSIEWIGKAVQEPDLSKSLVQFVFAIECLLQFTKGGFVTPSIVSQLSDWLAFIIHDDLVKRKEIATIFKKIYQKRSAIAHGANKAVHMQDALKALQISKLMVIAFLTTAPFCKMRTIKELEECITDMKFR